jgi:hypothetical protein
VRVLREKRKLATTNTQTQNSSTGSLIVERIAWGRLWLVGLFAIIASVVVNAVIAIAAVSFLPIPASSMQIRIPMVYGVFTVIGALGAVLVFALVARFSRRPIRLFRIIATVVLVLTFVPDLALFSFLGGAVPVAILLLMHVATYLICVGMLTTMTRAR